MRRERNWSLPWLQRIVALAALTTAALFIGVGGANAALGTVLINGGGTTSQEYLAASAQGATITVVSDATWATMTAAGFGAYELLVVRDGPCGSVPAGVLSSASVWAPVVLGLAGGRTLAGNRIVIGTDPALHSGGFSTARATIIRTGLAFAGKQPGRTGMYFTTSCGGSPAPVLAALTAMSTGSGSWTGAGAPCGGSVSLIASEPSFATLTTATLQGWGCSVHEAYPTFPSDWSALAVATDTATKPTCGIDPGDSLSHCGQAYILISGSSIIVLSGSISVTPLTGTNPAFTDHTVTAHVTAGGSPLVGQVVTWTVTGQNAGAVGTCAPVGCITDSAGDVSFTYHDTNGAGSDTIKASFVDAAHSLQAATAAKDWVAPLDADLRVVSKVDTADPVLLGSTFSYVVTVGNAGPANATGVTVTDTLPAGLSFVSGAGCTNVGPIVTCVVGALAAGSTAGISFIVNADAIGTWTDTARVSGDQPDLDLSNNSKTESTTVQAVTDLQVVSKTDSADPVLHGDTFSYTVVVRNNGPSNATGVTVTDTLPGGLVFFSSPDCTAVGPLVTCPVGALASGSSASVTFSVTATSAGVKTDTASVTGDQTDPVLANNSKSESTTVDPVVALSVTKTGTASIFWGDNATYTIVVSNAGPDAATGVEVTDSIAGPGTFVSGTAAGGACTISAGLVHCPVGTIAAGDSSTVTIVVTGDSPGLIVDKAHAVGNETELDLSDNGASAATDVLAHPTAISYIGDTTSDYHDPAHLSALLTDTHTGAFLGSKPVDFTLGLQTCSDGTDALGLASCTITPNVAAGLYPLSATFAGGPYFLGSTTTGTFKVTKEETVIVYDGPTTAVVYGDSLVLSATLKQDGTVAIAGRSVTLTIGTGGSAQSCVDTTNAAGQASCTIAAVHQPAGTAPLSADFAGDTFYLPSSDGSSLRIVHHTAIVYTGVTSQDYNDAATLSAKLIDGDTGAPLSGLAVALTGGSQSCADSTNASGSASCSIVINQLPGTYTASATFAGTANYLPSSDTSPFKVTKEETATVYTGVTGYVANGSTVTLSATLKEDGVTPIAGRTIVLTLGSQSCSDVTNASGVASCTVVVSQVTGPVTVTATFAGDAYYLPSSDSNSAFVYSFAPGGGAFVVGNQSATGSVTFWGAQWWKVNSLSGGAAPASFKGFAKNPATPSCGAAWSTDPGNSAPPPAGPLPTYMAVLVASTITKSGSQISGNTPHIVLVKTNAGYDANPGHAGTGTVIATLC